jgi:FlaA1/EpsC-like NDP-sugar epimerase/lipopolysaccharide/colanic/teichoic acid biosynthesis glycosyltransferase
MPFAIRFLDIFFSLIGIVVIVPILPIIGLLIKLDSKGSVFYLANRIGSDMRVFKMIKFRTMMDMPMKVGESVCPQFDPRVTKFGRFLRRSKLNELPQFFNILKGDMTFVGPRPESPDLADLYPKSARPVLQVKPGLIGPSSISGRNEEECFPPGVDPKSYYIESILPGKVELDLEYIKHPTLNKYFKYILLGVKETFTGTFSKRQISANQSQLYLLLADTFLILCSYLLAFNLFAWSIPGEAGFIHSTRFLLIVILVRLFCNMFFGMYRSMVRYLSYRDFFAILKATTSASIILIFTNSVLDKISYSISIAVIDWVSLVALLCAVRYGLKLYWDQKKNHKDKRAKQRILIYGACDEGYAACRAMGLESSWLREIVGFIDDEPNKYGKTLNGRMVLGNRHHLGDLTKLYNVEEIIIADPNIRAADLDEIIVTCNDLGLNCRIFSSGKRSNIDPRFSFSLRNTELTDILPLQQNPTDLAKVAEILNNKTVLVNGSGGALGVELCRNFLNLGCKQLIIIERYESYLNELVAALFKEFSEGIVIPVLDNGDGEDEIGAVFEKYRPQLVFQAGMRKFLPLHGVDLGNLGQTNYMRTFMLANLAARFGCEFFVMISSLMAVEGGNLINDSLRIAEISLEYFFCDTKTRLIIARMCDIIENRGGIVSIIEEQIKNRRTVTLPGPNARVRLISKHAAAEYILYTLVAEKKGKLARQIFDCDIGSFVSLIDVTKALATLYNFKLGCDLEIQYNDHSNELLSTLHRENDLQDAGDGGLKEENITSNAEKIRLEFKEFVRICTGKAVFQDWQARTHELMNLCQPDLSVKKS